MFTVGDTYTTKRGRAECIFIKGMIAYLTFPGNMTAYPYGFDGSALELSADYDVTGWG